MTPLKSLKQILQEHLEVCQESEAYKESICDPQMQSRQTSMSLILGVE
jgi:hypothetical protein